MKRKLKTVPAFAAAGPLSEAQLRWQIFNAANNGMDTRGVVVRIGRRVYLDEDRYDEWIDAQQLGHREVAE